MSIFMSNRGRWWFAIAIAIAGMAACGGGGGAQYKPDARQPAFRDADIYDAPVEPPLQACTAPTASCDDQNPCTTDSFDPDTCVCVNDPVIDGTSCVSADLCSVETTCKAGLCVASKTKDCTVASDQCHKSGYCLPTTGLCAYPNAEDHTACDDGDLCTSGDQCLSGVCTAAPIQCGAGLACDPKTGQCPGFPTATWGTVFDPSASTVGAIDSTFSDLTVSAKGSLYFTAGFANTLDLGAGPMSTTSNPSMSVESFDYNAVIARLDPASGRALWSKSLGDKANQVGSSIAANSDDIVLVSGVYSGKIDFGPVQGVDAGTLAFANTSSYPKAFFVAVDGASGKVLWALPSDISGDGTAPSLRTKVAVDPFDNNFVLCGSPTALASGLNVTHYGGKGDVLVAKLRAQDGQILWTGQYGSPADESCDAITADGAGKLYIAGHLARNSSLDFGNGNPLVGPSSSNQQAMYVVQLDAVTGTAGWTKVFRASPGSNAGNIRPTSLATDGKLVWVGGSFTYTAVFDQTTPLTSGSGSGDVDAGVSASHFTSAFVAALAATSGTASWSKNWGLQSEVSALALNSSGALLLAGFYASGMVFATNQLIDATGQTVPFAAKLTGTNGDAQTARGYATSSASASAFQSLALDKTSSTSTRDVPYALGVLDYSIGINLGAPVGVLPAPDASVDGGTRPSKATLFIVKFNP
jgi:hypothetical protein